MSRSSVSFRLLLTLMILMGATHLLIACERFMPGYPSPGP